MKKFFIATLLSVWTCCVFGQADFRQGYIITHNGDTLHGLLDYREASRRYRVCTFKTSAEAQSKEFGPEEIQGYRFLQSGFFVSESIEVDGKGSQAVFLEVLVAGRMSLFRHENDFFVSKDDSLLHKLVHNKHRATKHGRLTIVDIKRYIGLLEVLMADRPDMKTAIQRVTISEHKLTELVKAYNGLHDAPVTVYKSRLPYTHASVGIMGGANISRMQLPVDDPLYEYLRSPFEISRSAVFGLSVDLSSPRINQHVSFHTGMLYQRSVFYSYTMVQGPSFIDRHYVTIAIPSLKVPIGMKYTFPERKYTPYVNAGVLGHYRIGGESEWIKERETDNGVETYVGHAVDLHRKQLGLWGGAGLQRALGSSMNIFAEFRYSRLIHSTRLIGWMPNVGPSISSLQFFLGIRTR